MTYTVHLEVKSNKANRTTSDFYKPGTEQFVKYPRSQNGFDKAINYLMKTLNKNQDWIEDFRIVIYEGKYAFYKQEMKPIAIIDSLGNQLN